MAAEVIREFLVSLGYKQDESALRNFSEGIGKATKAVLSLSAAITGSATVVAAAVASWAGNLEDLYFAAQRTGMSATSIKTFQLAVRDLGASGDEALAAIEGIAHAVLTNPGIASVLHSWGAQLKDGKVSIQDMLTIAHKFRQMSPALGAMFAQQLEIPYKVFLAMRSGEFDKEIEHAQSVMKGMDWDKITANAHKFEGELRDLGTLFEWFGGLVEDALLKKFNMNFEKIKQWIVANGPWLAARVTEILLQIVDAATKLWGVFQTVTKYLKELDAATGGWSTKILALLAILKVSGAGSLIGGVLQLSAAFISLGIATAPVTLTLTALAAAVVAIDSVIKAFKGEDPSNPISTWINRLLFGEGGNLGGAIYEATHRSQAALRFFQDHGYSAAQAAGIVANLQRESRPGLDPTAENQGHYGIAQLDPARQAEYERRTGKSFRGSSFEEQLANIDWELRNHPEYGGAMLRASKTAADAALIFGQQFERYALPGQNPQEDLARARLGTQIFNDIDIHVSGAGDPRAVADKLHGIIQRAGGPDTAREYAGAVR